MRLTGEKKYKARVAVANKEREKRKRKLYVGLEKVMKDPDSAFNKCTLKQQGFIRSHVLEGKTKHQAALENYNLNSDNSARAAGGVIANYPKVKLAIREIYDNMGITDEYLTQVMQRGLEAKKEVFMRGEGLVQSDIPDCKIQLEFLKFAHEVKGDVRPRVGVPDSGGGIDVHIPAGVVGSDEVEHAVQIVLKKKFKRKGDANKVDIVDGAVVQ
jgi:hypothetical protein